MSSSLDYAHTHLRRRSGRRVTLLPGLACMVWSLVNGAALRGQTSTAEPQSEPPRSAAQIQRMADIEHRLDAVTDALAQAQQALQKSLLEIQTLRGQLDALRSQSGPAPEGPESMST